MGDEQDECQRPQAALSKFPELEAQAISGSFAAEDAKAGSRNRCHRMGTAFTVWCDVSAHRGGQRPQGTARKVEKRCLQQATFQIMEISSGATRQHASRARMSVQILISSPETIDERR
jgi:hypothetical protein